MATRVTVTVTLWIQSSLVWKDFENARSPPSPADRPRRRRRTFRQGAHRNRERPTKGGPGCVWTGCHPAVRLTGDGPASAFNVDGGMEDVFTHAIGPSNG